MSRLGAPVGPGTDPGLFDAKNRVLRSGEIPGSWSFTAALLTDAPRLTGLDHGAPTLERVAE